jgi:ABC-type uncharacterized transport system ATPase subunit
LLSVMIPMIFPYSERQNIHRNGKRIEELKTEAKWITRTNDENGVGMAIDRFNLTKYHQTAKLFSSITGLIKFIYSLPA